MKLKKSCLVIILVLLYTTPIVFLMVQSKEEMKAYECDDIEIEEKAYGELCQVVRQDVESNISIDVEGVSTKTKVIEVSGEDCVWNVEKGEEVMKGECIGKVDSSKIKCKYNGIIKEVKNKYVRIQLIDNVCYETYVDSNDVKYFTGKLKDEQGNEIEKVSISNIQKDGKIRIVFNIKNRNIQYGEKIEDMVLYNGETYKNALTIKKKCVKQKEDKKYYVRVVDEAGNYLGEQEVQLGYEYKGYVCVTGVEEDEWCDGGYYRFEELEEE